MLKRIGAARTSLIALKPFGGHNRRADALPRTARKLVDGAALNAQRCVSHKRRLRSSLAHSMPKQSVKPTFRTRYGRCLFGRWSVANTNANGEHQAPSWTPSQGMSIRAIERENPQILNAIRCSISTF